MVRQAMPSLCNFNTTLNALGPLQRCHKAVTVCGVACRRANCIRELYIQDGLVTGTMPAAVMAAVLGSQCSSPERLYMHAAHVCLADQDIAALAVLTGLKSLQVQKPIDPTSAGCMSTRDVCHANAMSCFCLQVTVSTVLFEDCCTTLIWAVQQLPVLTFLDIHHDGTVDDVFAPVSDDNGLPHCQQLAALHSNSLTELRVCMLGAPPFDNMLRLVGLPKLQSLQLIGERYLPLNMRIDAASFQGAPMLEELYLAMDEGLELQPGSLVQLSALAALAMVGCGLRTVPEDVAFLCATLRRLDLSSNESLQIDDAGLASILHCSHLDVSTCTSQT